MDENHSIIWEQVTCAKCGVTGTCTPSTDYYTSPFWTEPGRLCEGCFRTLIRENTGINKFYEVEKPKMKASPRPYRPQIQAMETYLDGGGAARWTYIGEDANPNPAPPPFVEPSNADPGDEQQD